MYSLPMIVTDCVFCICCNAAVAKRRPKYNFKCLRKRHIDNLYYRQGSFVRLTKLRRKSMKLVQVIFHSHHYSMVVKESLKAFRILRWKFSHKCHFQCQLWASDYREEVKYIENEIWVSTEDFLNYRRPSTLLSQHESCLGMVHELFNLFYVSQLFYRLLFTRYKFKWRNKNHKIRINKIQVVGRRRKKVQINSKF